MTPEKLEKEWLFAMWFYQISELEVSAPKSQSKNACIESKHDICATEITNIVFSIFSSVLLWKLQR